MAAVDTLIEEAQCWSQAVESLDEFMALRSDQAARDAPLSVNRLIFELPEDDAKLYDTPLSVRQNLVNTLESMKDHADKELAYASPNLILFLSNLASEGCAGALG